MKSRLIYLLFVLFLKSVSYGQNFEGKITDSANGLPIPYCGIGIVNKAIGTVSGQDGRFDLNLSKAAIGDTLRVTEIGYSKKEHIINSNDKAGRNADVHLFKLGRLSFALDSVTIHPQGELKYITIGNTVNSDFVCVGFSSSELGTEIGAVLKYRKHSHGLIESLNFNISKCLYDSVLFQVNLYNYDDGVIGASLLKRPIIIEPKIRKGTLSVDVKDSSIVIYHDILLSLELIRVSKRDLADSSTFDKLAFNAGFFSSATYNRRASQDVWEKLPDAGVGFWAKVSYYK